MATSTGKRGKSQVEESGAKPPARPAQVSAHRRSTCEDAVTRVIRQALVLDDDTHKTRGNLPSGRTSPTGEEPQISAEAASADARACLTTTLRELDPETALKVRTLMIAGRDGQSIGVVETNVSLSDTASAFAIMADDSSENGPLLAEYLRRGHAIACAVGIDLDRPLDEWQMRSTESVEQRAWLSFGRQLANSSPRDWQCLGVVDARTQTISKLYLKLGDRAWWSFQALIDRPTKAGMAKERRVQTRQRTRSFVMSSLDALASKLEGLQGRALQRAGRAIQARISGAQPAVAS
jgi:hypothetical protein